MVYAQGQHKVTSTKPYEGIKSEEKELMMTSIESIPYAMKERYGEQVYEGVKREVSEWYNGDKGIESLLYGERANYGEANSIAVLNIINEDFSVEDGVLNGLYRWYRVLKGYGEYITKATSMEGILRQNLSQEEKESLESSIKDIKMMSDIVLVCIELGVNSEIGRKLQRKLELWDVSYELTKLKMEIKQIGIRVNQKGYKSSLKYVKIIEKMRIEKMKEKRKKHTRGLKRGKMDEGLKSILRELDSKEIDVYDAGKTNSLYKWVRPNGYILKMGEW